MALLLISHNLDVMAAHVERLAGDVRRHASSSSGPTRAVFERLRASVHARAVRRGPAGCLGLARGTRLATIPGRVPANSHEMPPGCAFADRCALASTPDCRRAAPA
jgi:peptide/nickel transport system ATP-binding protein